MTLYKVYSFYTEKKKGVLEILKAHPKGLKISDLARKINLNNKNLKKILEKLGDKIERVPAPRYVSAFRGRRVKWLIKLKAHR